MLIERCIKSILNQDVNQLEVIAVDDGSSDNSLSVMQKIAQEESRLKIISKENGGASSARNIGIKAATGDYIMFVDSDDYILENSLNKAMCEAFMLYHAPDIVYFGLARESISGDISISKPSTRFYDKKEIPEIFFKYDQLLFGSPCFKLYRKDIINKNSIEFDTSMHNYEDAVFNFNFVRYCENAVSIAIPIYCYDCRSNVSSKLPSLFGGKHWFSDLTKYHCSMSDFCQQTDPQHINWGGKSPAQHSLANNSCNL